MSFLSWLFHSHCWEILEEGRTYIDAWERRPMKALVMRCSMCGELTERQIGA